MRVAVFINNRAEYGCLLKVLESLENPYPIFGGDLADSEYPRYYPNARRMYGLLKFSTHANMARTASLLAMNAASILEEIKPDRVVIVGDRYEVLGVAMAAAYMNIRICHVQGGEVSGTIDESIRHAVTKLSHIHCVSTHRAAKVVESLGEDPNYVRVTGCPTIDLLGGPSLSSVFYQLNQLGIGGTLDPRKPFVIVSYHPVTTDPEELSAEDVMRCVDTIDAQKIVFHPNSDAGRDDLLKHLRQWSGDGRVVCQVGPREYGALLRNAKMIVGNSSSGIRSGSHVGVPCINIGHRQDHREQAGNVTNVLSVDDLVCALSLKVTRYPQSTLYGNGGAGKQIAESLSLNPPIQKRLCYDLSAL